MPDALTAFLDAFPASAAGQVRSVADAAVVVTDTSLRQFRLDPSAGLAAIRVVLEQRLQADPPPTAIVWCQAGDPGNGLEAFELAAVLGRWLHITLVHQSSSGDEQRVVVVGRPRRELVAVAFTIESDVSDSQLTALLGASTGGTFQPILFITAARMREIHGGTPAADAFTRHQSSGGAVALLVPDLETDVALSNPRSQLEPFEQRGLLVRMVRFERGLAIDPSSHDGFMRGANLVCDSSVPIDSGMSGERDLVRAGAYAGPSPYRPQPFDLRVPWFHCTTGMWIELPAFPVGAYFERDFRDHVLWPRDEELATRLDANRMAAFYRASRISPALERFYPDYRLYNWPRSAPSRRVSLLDGGPASLERKRAVDGALDNLATLTMSRVGQDDLLEAARSEVVERYGLSSAGAIDVQHASHAYLADVPRGAALRQDYAEFARFAPADLGSALEIGSGYGVLAWALSVRARRYVCLDLDARMFRGLRRDLEQSGVVADAHQLPFVDGAFDSVVANNVIEHLHDPLAGLQEIRRILRPGGRLLALLPFDALNSRHELPAHHWKIDKDGLQRALAFAGLDISRLEVVNLHKLGVPGAFPSCHGFVAMVDAQRPVGVRTEAPASIVRRAVIAVSKNQSERAGRVWPSVREMVRFEQWTGKRVVAVGADPQDLDEFRHFGAALTEVPADSSAWDVTEGSADLVYVFLSVSKSQLLRVASETRRVLAAGGVAVAVFRNRGGLRHLARVGSYFGDACDLRALAGPNALVQMADDQGAEGEDAYVSAEEIDRGFGDFARRQVKISNLTPDDLATEVDVAYPEPFWDWLGEACGRFVMVRAER